MQSNKRINKLFIVIVLAAFLLPNQIFALTREVTVSIPSFPVTLNGVVVDNTYRQYPLLVYKDITYFPMTYYDNRFLGVETNWSRETGLVIDQTGVSAAYRDYKGKVKNSKSYKAAVRTNELQLNGRAIDSNKEPYPFLIFRDVTYFPLTWKFAVHEFGWNYSFNSNNGLVIQSSNPQVKKLTSVKPMTGEAVVVNGNHYYIGEKGAVIQAPLEQPKQTKVIYQLPLWSEGDGTTYVHASLSNKAGEVWLYYHQGGAVMGSDHYLKLSSSGVFEEEESGYLSFKNFGDTRVKFNLGAAPGPNNLYIKTGNQAYKSVGDSAYLYGWNWEIQDNGTQGGVGSSDLYLVDNQIYVLAFHMEKDTDYSRIHKVDLATNVTSRVNDLKVEDFVIVGETLYLISDGKLIRMVLNSSQEEVVMLDGKVSWMKSEDGYLICAFVKESTTPYGMIVIDAAGEVVFKTSDVVGGVSILKGELSYTESLSGNIYGTVLP